MEQNLRCRKGSVPTALFKQSPVSTTKPTPPSCWAVLGKDSMALWQAQHTRNSLSRDPEVGLPCLHAAGQVPVPCPCTVMLFGSREHCGSQGMPTCCWTFWGAAGRGHTWEPVQAAGTLPVPPSLQGFTHTAWDKLSLVPQRCSHPPFLGCHVSVT